MAEFISKVYNQEIKDRFIDEIGVDKYPYRWWERVFEKVYKFEEKYQKDFYSFTTNEILEFYKYLNLKSMSSLIVYNANLTHYGAWALQNNMILDGQNHFYEIDSKLLSTCVDKMFIANSVITYEQLIHSFNQFNSHMDKYLVFALFEGIKGKDFSEITDLRIEDIDKENKLAHLSSGRIIPVSNEFINICVLANNEVGYEIGGKKKTFVDTGYIYKQTNKGKGVKKSQSVYRRIINTLGYLGIDSHVTPNNIMSSGMLHYVRKKAEELGISARDFLNSKEYKDEVDKIFAKYNFNRLVKARFILQYEDFMD